MEINYNLQLIDRYRIIKRRIQCDVPGNKRDIVLGFLKTEGRMKQQDIADELHICKSTLSEMIRKLEKDGFVRRESDPADRRTVILTLTEAGDKRAEEVIEERIKMMEVLFSHLTDSEKIDLIRLLDKLLGSDTDGRN